MSHPATRIAEAVLTLVPMSRKDLMMLVHSTGDDWAALAGVMDALVSDRVVEYWGDGLLHEAPR